MEATFVPAEVPRDSWLALWRQNVAIAGADDELELAVPAGQQIRRRVVPRPYAVGP